MTAVQQSAGCRRIREQVSLHLDDQLSEFEERMLAFHLARCPACNAYAADVSAFTEQLRSAPFEVLDRPIVLRRRLRTITTRMQVGVAAAVTFATVGIGSQLAESESRADFSPPVIEYATRAELDHEQALLNALDVRTTVSTGSFAL